MCPRSCLCLFVFTQGSADPKHEYELGAGCSVSVIKEVKTGGKIIYAFQLEWPQLHQEKEGAETETEGAGCGRFVCNICACTFGVIVCVFLISPRRFLRSRKYALTYTEAGALNQLSETLLERGACIPHTPSSTTSDS